MNRQAPLRTHLHRHHRLQLTDESGISEDVILGRGYHTVKEKAELARLGFSPNQQLAPALLIPMYSPMGELVTHQIKSDTPRTDENAKKIKYETPAGSDVHLDVHPSQAKRVKDPALPLWITEGVKKGDSLVSRGQCVVVLQGVWCWQKGGIPLPEWGDIKLYGRKVVVVFDSDIMMKSEVQAALEGLVAFLKSRGATVKVVYLPNGEDGKKQGVDDYLAAGGTIRSLLWDYAKDELVPSRKDLDAIDTTSRQLPPANAFPEHALPKACRRLLKEAAAAIGCPPDFIALPMLVTLGAGIGNSCTIKLKEGWEESAAIYGNVIAEPGEKKSPAMKVAVEPAMKQQAVLRDDYRKKMDGYKRELREYEVEKKEAAKDGLPAPPPPEEPVMERTVVEDTTVEALTDVLEGTPRGVLAMHDELSGWVRGMDQYKTGGKGADRQFWLSVWSNSSVVVDRKNRREPLILQRPFVGVIGTIQPGVLPELGKGREDGMLDRFLHAYPEPLLSRWSDDEISVEARVAYKALYDDLRKLHILEGDPGDPNPVRVVLAPDARGVFIDAVNEHREEMEDPGFPTRLKGPWSKLEAYLARLSLILALARVVEDEAPERVEVHDVLRAVVLVDYFKNQARRVHLRLYGENLEDRFAEDVARFLEKRGGRFKGEPAELHKHLKSDFKPPRVDELSKRLKAIASRTSTLGFRSSNFWKDGQSRRFVELTLENGVKGAKGVKNEAYP